MKLLGLTKDTEVEISGTKVVMRPMNRGDNYNLLMIFNELDKVRDANKDDHTAFLTALNSKSSEIDKILTKYVVSIDLPEVTDITDELWNSVSFEDYIAFATSLLNISQIGSKAKNSD